MYEFKPLEQENIIFICSLMSEPNNISALHTDIIPLDEWRKTFAEAENDVDEENFIIYNKDIPCGWLKLNGLQNDDTAWISMLVVSEKFKHQGIGKIAVEFAVQYLKHREFRYINLQTTIDNSVALSLYSNCGFTIVNQSSTKITMCKEV